MRRKEYIEFYKVGLDIARGENHHEVLNHDGEEISAKDSPNEYAHYFARQCISDVNTRNMKQWGKMPLLKWFFLYRIPGAIERLFAKAKRLANSRKVR